MPKKIEIPPTFDALVSCYLRGEASVSDIAIRLSVSKATILKWMDSAGVARHSPSVMISAKLKGRPSHRKGVKHTAEAIAKISAARSGKATTTGFKFTEASKEKMRQSAIARIANTDALLKMQAGRARLKLPDSELSARRKAREACKRMLRRVLQMARIRKDKKTEVLLGYTKEQLRAHLEAQFRDGISWAERGSFHIDHIKPVAQFFREGVTDPAVINALTNLQVLTPVENQRKSDSFSDRNRRHALMIDKTGTKEFT